MPPSTTNLPLTFPVTDQLKDQIRYLESVKADLQTENARLREILQAADKVRNRQKRYFASRSKGSLRSAIKAEKELDQLMDRFYASKVH